jgi:hypothetical protein
MAREVLNFPHEEQTTQDFFLGGGGGVWKDIYLHLGHIFEG